MMIVVYCCGEDCTVLMSQCVLIFEDAADGRLAFAPHSWTSEAGRGKASHYNIHRLIIILILLLL